eukprot:TRINITY_DN257_c0_g1_i2.p1 TRINITY_DN257_c0_g1~~TRINITY_DN257_c0_g1_i2.p1  ORF type:complete len:293 (+),score=92.14 TRINITY_DN257_c0_g1_i2:466-1344(+)
MANPYVDSGLSKTERLQRILTKYEITIAEASDLVALEGYEIVFVIDDSGSMSLPSEPASKRTLGKNRSRWEELGETVKMVAELACVFDDDGIDLYFLNRPALKGIKSADDATLVAALSSDPSGGTPLTETVQRVVNDFGSSERPVLMLIATDGEPNGGPGRFVDLVTHIVKKKNTSRTFKFQILACTDDASAVSWLDDFDKRFDEVDVTDDYWTERDQVLKSGRCHKFNRSDWVTKALLGPIIRKFDAWDEASPVPHPGVQTFPYPEQPRGHPPQAHPPKSKKKDDGCCTLC